MNYATRQDLLKIQQDDLNHWKRLLKPEVYTKLEREVYKRSSIPNSCHVCRGQDLYEIVVNFEEYR